MKCGAAACAQVHTENNLAQRDDALLPDKWPAVDLIMKTRDRPNTKCYRRQYWYKKWLEHTYKWPDGCEVNYFYQEHNHSDSHNIEIMFSKLV